MSLESTAQAWMEWRRKNASDYDEPEWIEGMSNTEGDLVVAADLNGDVRWYGHGELSDWMEPDDEDVPDMNWAPNIAYLTIDVCRAWGDETISLINEGGLWGLRCGDFRWCCKDGENALHRGKAVALHAALLAAPETT